MPALTPIERNPTPRGHAPASSGAVIAALLAALALQSCDEQRHFARVFQIAEMAQTIGGPAAAARPGDYLLENEQIRAVIHGRHNERSTLPLSNGSLIDLDIQRPYHEYGVGKGADAFYELGGMVNLKVNSSRAMAIGPAEEVGAAAPPKAGCARVTASGPGENFIGVLGLLDLAMTRPYPTTDLELVTDYDVCPGEPVIRVTTTARFYGKGEPLELEPLHGATSLLATLLGESQEIDCAKQPCPAGSDCDDMLRNLSLGSLSTEMKRCRKPDQRLAGVMTGDLVLMSGKVRAFTPGSGFDHDTYVRSVFDSGGDIFSSPLALDFIAAVGKDVSYAYFEQRGKLMIPVFSESFTVSMTNSFACPRKDPKCMEGRELRYHRYVSVGHGDVASALAGFYRIRDIPTGEVQGHVTDVRTGAPVSGMNVFVLRLPRTWEALPDSAIAAKRYEELIAANQEETRSDTRPLGEVGIVSHFRTDAGLDPIKDGSFSGQLPAGRYALVVRDDKRPASALVPLRVSVGQIATASLFAGEHGRLEYDVVDEAGRHLPSKLTIGRCFAECARDEDCGGATPYCFVGSRKPCQLAADCAAMETCTMRGCVAIGRLAGVCTPTRDGSYHGADECRPDQVWDEEQATCTCRSLALPLELHGRRNSDGTERTVLSASGRGVVELPPGTYQLIASRGIEYEVKRAFVTLRPGSTTRFAATLPRVVDSSSWIGADFHVHGPNSVDSGLDHRARVASYAAEGVELLSASDHDQLTDYAPTIYDLNLGKWLKSQVGLEVSPLDYGHFLGFPLVFDENAELNGAFHWRKPRGGEDEDVDWQNLPPQEIYNELRKRGALGPENTVVAVAHFYDHFTFFSVDPWTLQLPPFNITAMTNLVLLPSNFSGDFDALEGLNGKGIDLIRRPSYEEVRDYNIKVGQILGDLSRPYPERQQAWAKISAEAQRAFFVRTEEEQLRVLGYANADFACRCAADSDCGLGFLCDERTGDCIRSCSGDEACDPLLVAAGREGCLPHAKNSKNEQRRTCQRVAQPCGRNAECLRVSWETRVEKCIAVDPAKPQERTCELACNADPDCDDPLRPKCLDKRCQEHPVQAATADDPCPTLRGTVDDWFTLLNHGVRRTMLGNSDSHDTYGGEAGLPRNYVRSSADTPPAIDRLEIARNVKAGRSFPTYGPFIEVTVNDQPIGATVTAAEGARVRLHVRVQSPRWFDVDRLEIYRNAELVRVVTGRTDCGRGEVACIRVPNDRVVNYDQEIDDLPSGDSWYVVVAMGAEGKGMAPVYSSTPVARLGIFELIQRLTPLLPPLRSLRTPFSPSITEVRPYAVTNPIFVDVGGDGYEAPEPAPGWAARGDQGEGSADMALHGLRQTSAAGGPAEPAEQAPAQGHAHDHAAPSSDRRAHEIGGHDHRRGIGRMRAEAADFEQLLRQGKVTDEVLRRAFDALRYLR